MQKKHFSTLACLLALTSCSLAAQNSVQIYGLADTGIEYLSRSENGRSITRMPTLSGGQMPSRLGFKGEEQISPNLAAIFTFETGLSLTTGATLQSARAFGRQAFVGLKGSWGRLTLGRQYTMGFQSLLGSDLLGPAAFGIASLDLYLPNQRIDHSIAYQHSIGDWRFGALYSNGRDSKAPSNCGPTGKSSECAAYSAMLQYDNKRWGIALAQDKLKGKEGSLFFGQPTNMHISNKSSDTHTYLAGYAMLGKARLGAGLIHRQLKTQQETYRSHQYYLAASYPLTAKVVLDATYTYLAANRSQSDAQLIAARASYNFSKRTSVYALLGRVHNQSRVGYSVSSTTIVPASPGLGRSQTGAMFGMRHTF